MCLCEYKVSLVYIVSSRTARIHSETLSQINKYLKVKFIELGVPCKFLCLIPSTAHPQNKSENEKEKYRNVVILFV